MDRVFTDRDYARAALNCEAYNDGTHDRFCARCGSPMRLHADRGKTLRDAGFVRGDHPAWLAIRGSDPTSGPRIFDERFA